MSYEVWGEPDEIPECPYCKENAEEKDISDKIVDDLSQLVSRLVQALRKASPDNDLSEKAMDYLKRNDLLGSPLRETWPIK
jgi:hypothetical protein